MSINVIGAGLAGCEAAWRVAKSGEEVNLFEMKLNLRQRTRARILLSWFARTL